MTSAFNFEPNGEKFRRHSQKPPCVTQHENPLTLVSNAKAQGLFTLGDTRSFSGLTSKIPPLGAMLNSDADFNNMTVRHQCENRFTPPPPHTHTKRPAFLGTITITTPVARLDVCTGRGAGRKRLGLSTQTSRRISSQTRTSNSAFPHPRVASKRNGFHVGARTRSFPQKIRA